MNAELVKALAIARGCPPSVEDEVVQESLKLIEGKNSHEILFVVDRQIQVFTGYIDD